MAYPKPNPNLDLARVIDGATLKLEENDIPSHCCIASGLEGNLVRGRGRVRVRVRGRVKP